MTFSWEVFWRYVLSVNFAQGAWTTIWLAVVAQALGTLVGLGMALLGVSDNRVFKSLSRFYVWLFRGIPPLVQLIMLYFALPQLGVRLSSIQAGLVGLSLGMGAIMAEIIRSGLLSVGKGQREAARALGMSPLQSLRLIVLPQALRVILPPFGNEFNSMMRTTSLLSVIAVEELLREASLGIADTFRPVELYSAASVYYLIMTTTWNALQRRVECFVGRGGSMGDQDRRNPLAAVVSQVRGLANPFSALWRH